MTAGEQVVPASGLASAIKQIKELQRLLGKKTMENELLKEAVEYGYRRVWAMLRRQSENENIAIINAKRIYRIMKQSALLLERKPAISVSKRAHTGKMAVNESNQCWCSDGCEFRCDNGEKLRVMFALDCCDREALHGRLAREASTVKPCNMS